MTKEKTGACIIPCLTLKNADKAIELYKKALGAQEEHKMLCPETGVVAHCGLKIGESALFISEEREGCGPAAQNQQFYLYVPDCDKAIEKAVKSGMAEAMKAEDMFWGDRMGVVTDPFGIKWSIATHQRVVPEKEMQEGMKKMMEKMKSQAA